MLLIANPRVKEIRLKPNPVLRRQIRLPMPDNIRKRPFRRNMHEHMDVVWHNQK